jgi:hypothetical protein
VTDQTDSGPVKRWEPVSALVAGLSALVGLLGAVTQQRPVSTITVAGSLLLIAAVSVVRVVAAKRASGGWRYPRARRFAVAGAVAAVVLIATLFVVPGPRRFVVYQVLGFPSIVEDVRIDQVIVEESDAAYNLHVSVLSRLAREELIRKIELSSIQVCKAPPAADFRIQQDFVARAGGDAGTSILGKVSRPAGDDKFFASVTGSIRNSPCGQEIAMSIATDTPLPTNQHVKIVIEIPKTMTMTMTHEPTKAPQPPPTPGQSPLPMTPDADKPVANAVPIHLPTTPEPRATMEVRLSIGNSEVSRRFP